MAKKKTNRVSITISQNDRDRLESAIRDHWAAERVAHIKNLKFAMKNGSYGRAKEEIECIEALDFTGDFYLSDLDVDWVEPK